MPVKVCCLKLHCVAEMQMGPQRSHRDSRNNHHSLIVNPLAIWATGSEGISAEKAARENEYGRMS